MTNDENQKKHEARNPKRERRSTAFGASGFPSDFDLRISDFFRHSSFAIRHYF